MNGTRLPQVSVFIEFELQGCDTTLNCQRTFYTHIYETSTENATAARNINNYRQIQRVSPNLADGSRENATIIVSFNSGHSSFHFTIQDETSCLVITRMIIFYYICPQQTVDLVDYPETLAPIKSHIQTPLIFVTGYCVKNTEPESGRAPLLVCSIGGIWSIVPESGCRCVAGHYFYNETMSCECECMFGV